LHCRLTFGYVKVHTIERRAILARFIDPERNSLASLRRPHLPR